MIYFKKIFFNVNSNYIFVNKKIQNVKRFFNVPIAINEPVKEYPKEVQN